MVEADILDNPIRPCAANRAGPRDGPTCPPAALIWTYLPTFDFQSLNPGPVEGTRVLRNDTSALRGP